MNKLVAIVFFFSSIFLSSCEKSDVSRSEQKQIDQYLIDNNLIATEVTESGLVYIRTKESSGGEALSFADHVSVKYAGRFLSNEEFDAGSFSFNLGVKNVVEGFDEGVAKMKVGEQATFIIPYYLAYGKAGSSSIPAKSTLVFDIEVLEILED